MLERLRALLDQEQAEMALLGEPRLDSNVQRAYVHSIAEKFESLTKQSLASPADLPIAIMRLRGQAEDLKVKFANKLRENGHTYEFSNIFETHDTSGTAAMKTPLYDEIKTQISANRGEELQGMINPSVLKPLMQKQAAKWPRIGEEYLNDLAMVTRNAILEIFNSVCAELGIDIHTVEVLKEILEGFAAEGKSRAIKKLRQYWQEETNFHLQTVNPSFIANVQELQELRFKAALLRYRNAHSPKRLLATFLGAGGDLIGNSSYLEFHSKVYEDWIILDVNDVYEMFQEMHARGERNTNDEIHDLLKAYYKVI
jgi:hypothetical protein